MNQELYKRAKKIIPGGVQLFSKRPERFLPGKWPTYYSKAAGSYIWDLNGKCYLDMSYMGIGACILGYADSRVDNAVKNVIDEGSMSTLNCPEEVILAERLVKLHPGMKQVRFARTGGEACAIAVRIARAFTGKDNIAYCGYHGWHDWHLAGGTIEASGVPKALKGTAIPFEFGKMPKADIVIMEVIRDSWPKESYLKAIRKKAKVLIFDEITSGFRAEIGGAYKKLSVRPDIVILGKAMGNGYPISAVVGNSVMDACQDSFISSTFWTERIGPTAALATIDKLSENWEEFQEKGRALKRGLEKIGLKTTGLPTLLHFDLGSLKNQTRFNQEMLKENILATNAVYLSLSHEYEHIYHYVLKAEKIIKNLNKIKLDGKIITPGFKRLN
jgi:glutamate-1-semialdehyde 2,1-aminomutase